MEQPEGFHDGTDRVCLLKKAIYGTKQASRNWQRTLHKTLIEDSFTQCKSDECLYVLHRKGAVAYMLIYVDDIIIASTHQWLTKAVEDMLARRYEIKILGELKWYLGLHVEQTPDHIKIHQHSYVQQTLKRFKMDECNAEKTPLSAGCQLSKADSPQTEEGKVEMLSYPYRSLVGSLIPHGLHQT